MQESDIKPEIYSDHEVRMAIQELFSYQDFLAGMKAFVPVQLNDHILNEVNSIQTAHDFQKNVISPFLRAVEQSSITEFTFSGLENLKIGESYLFISNHRDIVLDSAYLNMVLLENGMRTSQIAIGDNLVANRLTELLFKINKSFVVKRSGNPREIYRHAIALSEYVHQTIVQKKDSVWIAQREGRSKDGNDRTQVSLLKMLSLCSQKDLKLHFQELQIVPVSISYEYDPCGLLKTQEYLEKMINPDYKKSFQQDAEHLMLGIKGNKGHVHFHFEKPLMQRLEQLDTTTDEKEKLNILASIIDKSIHTNYRLHPVNYYAYDTLMKEQKYISYYGGKQEAFLKNFFKMHIDSLPVERQSRGLEFLLRMYANPLINAESYSS